jgi:hypothetical protein
MSLIHYPAEKNWYYTTIFKVVVRLRFDASPRLEVVPVDGSLNGLNALEGTGEAFGSDGRGFFFHA